MQPIPTDRDLARIAAEHPSAPRIFHEHGLDFCASGARPLAEACSELGLDPEAVTREIALAEAGLPEDWRPWSERPLESVVAHILRDFHRPLDPWVPRIEELMGRIVASHGAAYPALREIEEAWRALRRELIPHIMKEEQVLFPWILAGSGRSAAAPIRLMRAEHELTLDRLKKLRGLMESLEIEERCASWDALCKEITALEGSLFEHIHLENQVLFPRALAGDA